MKKERKNILLSLVIPFYNDAGCAKPFIRELRKELRGINYELILVDDCSKDSTPEELDSLKDKKVKIIHNKINKDYGGAIMTGLNVARGKILGFTCGDGEITPMDIVGVYKKMGRKDIIKAVRLNRKDGLNRKIISQVFNLWARIKFGLPIKDINGYPVYFKKEAYQKVSNVRTDWIFNIDLFRKMVKEGYSIGDSTVLHERRIGGKSKMTPRRIFKMIIKFIKYR